MEKFGFYILASIVLVVVYFVLNGMFGNHHKNGRSFLRNTLRQMRIDPDSYDEVVYSIAVTEALKIVEFNLSMGKKHHSTEFIAALRVKAAQIMEYENGNSYHCSLDVPRLEKDAFFVALVKSKPIVQKPPPKTLEELIEDEKRKKVT